MSSPSEAGSNPGPGGPGPGPGGPGPGPGAPPPFKLRFAAPRAPGRSRVAAHRPLTLPCTVTGKFYARREAGGSPSVAREQFAEQRVRRLFAAAPSDHYHHPVTTQHEYGWYLNEDVIVNLMQWQKTDPAYRLLRHPIREILNQK